MNADVIDRLVGIEPGSRLDAVRAHRTHARDNAQLSYLSLFRPNPPGDVTLDERRAVAAFVAGLHQQPDIGAFYAENLDADLKAHVDAEIAAGERHGPYGRYPAGPLSVEDVPGAFFQVSNAGKAALGPRLSAAFAHAHFLVFHPRDATPEALQALLDAGWSTTGIVTMSQLVAFLSFQIRVVVGLRALAASA
jgi:CMD domain protein